MRAVIQRVSEASVVIGGVISGSIKNGLLVLIGIEDADIPEDAEWIAAKLVNMRIFNDEAGVMNLSVLQTGGDVLIVSQFTLHASIKKGNRPSYIRAAKPETAIPLYECFISAVGRLIGKKVETGKFGAMMEVSLVNDGPVTILVDSQNRE